MDPDDPGMPFYSVEARTAVGWMAHVREAAPSAGRSSHRRGRFDPVRPRMAVQNVIGSSGLRSRVHDTLTQAGKVENDGHAVACRGDRDQQDGERATTRKPTASHEGDSRTRHYSR